MNAFERTVFHIHFEQMTAINRIRRELALERRIVPIVLDAYPNDPPMRPKFRDLAWCLDHLCRVDWFDVIHEDKTIYSTCFADRVCEMVALYPGSHVYVHTLPR